ncbi:lysophospholipid acyltransferase family protein [Peterkaempfera griseoplana]|uniref:lysophospholipid acyltransferase family protein n=1 Tax=Peterkaempfera griseoplana TaxID=66896 RepID=UPI0006E3DEF4|nr:lysophospholipid acyltransferase family protein [Peterkaempfera griseoplana]
MARRSNAHYGFWYRLVAAIAKPPLALLVKREWSGWEHMPAEGGFITAVNHISYLDPLTYAHYQYNSGRPPRFLAKSGLFAIPVVSMLLRNTGQIPVFRESTDAAHAFRAAVAAVDKGECVAVYPEGTLTRDPDMWPMTGKSGAARIALMTGAPVIPVAQWGAQEIVPPYAKGGRGRRRFRPFPRHRVTVVAGPPVDLSRYQGRELTAEVLRDATEDIMAAITALLAEIRGEKAPEVRFDLRRSARQRRAERAAEAEAARPAGRQPAAVEAADAAEETTK